MTHSSITEAMHWRYAAKAMDQNVPAPQDKVDAIVEAVRMAPTSSGTQPFELFVITNGETKRQIRAAASDQSPITDGSHVLVFAAWDDYTDDRIDEVVKLNKDLRGDLPAIDAYYDNLKASYVGREPEVNYAHAARQAYIALGQRDPDTDWLLPLPKVRKSLNTLVTHID